MLPGNLPIMIGSATFSRGPGNLYRICGSHGMRWKGRRTSENVEDRRGLNGDHRLQQRSQGYIVPESFTHGTSEQRLRWFMKGLQTGDLSQGDTFSAAQL